MGSEPYYYFVRYQRDIEEALQQLRRREFEAGRYNPLIRRRPFMESPTDSPNSKPRTSRMERHGSIEEAREAAGADGTRSILDIEHIGDQPDFCVATRIDPEALKDLYGTTEPTHEMIEPNMGFLDDIERGHAIYVVVYKNGQPDELFFAGYSFD
jgi:hypothetical protein